MAIVSVSVNGTTGYVLTGGGDASIWRMPASGRPKRIVGRNDLDGVDSAGMSIVAFGAGVVVLGQKCKMDENVHAECITSSGIAQFFDKDGNPSHTTTLWKNKRARAGGTPAHLLTITPESLWVSGNDEIYAIDATGNVTDTVPRTGKMNVCGGGDALYAVDWDAPADLTAPDGQVTEGPDKSLPSGPVNLRKWNGDKWATIPSSGTSIGGPLPDWTCGADGIMLWNQHQLVALWQSGKGWRELPDPAAAVTAQSNEGIGYTLSDKGTLERLNPMTGNYDDLGLELRSEGADPDPNSLRVAERGDSVFACAYDLVGLPGAATERSTTCGFASIPG